MNSTLQRIVDLAVETIDGCEGAGLLVVDGREILAGAWSDEWVRGVETMEYEVGEGPCIDAIRERPVFESRDLRDEVAAGRRSRRAPSMRESRACSPSGSSPRRRRSVRSTCTAPDRGAFDEAARVRVGLRRGRSPRARGARVHERDLEQVEGLREALVSRDVIGQAKGILMATRKVDVDAAFELLRSVSNDLNRKLRAVAADVVRTGALPES